MRGDRAGRAARWPRRIRASRMACSYKQWIGGEWCDASNRRTKNVLNPATEEVIRAVPFGAGADCRAAIDAAHRAFRPWAQSTPYERGSILKRAADLVRA